MQASVFKGQLVYVATDEGIIQLEDRKDGEIKQLAIEEGFQPFPGWEQIVAQDVEVIVIDNRVKTIYPIEIEEE